MTEPAREAAEDANAKAQRVPETTTPTWETELLISVAVVFALFQAPGAVDEVFDRWGPRFAGGTHAIALFLVLYAKIVAFALIATFVTHLCARGYWTALVGIRSVFPAGIRWEHAGKRPLFLGVLKSELKTQSETIERVDNFASLIFGSGALLVILAVFSLVMSIVVLAASTVVSRLVFGGAHADAVLFATMAVFVVPFVLLGLVDRVLGARLDPQGGPARVLRGWFRFSLHFPLMRAANGLLLLFASNVGRRRGMALAIGGLYVLVLLTVVQGAARRDELHVDSLDYFPRSDQDALVPRHYAAARIDAQRFALAPYVQAETIADPYVRLFVPYKPSAFNAAIRWRCPETAAPAGARDAAVLACVSKLLAIELDDGTIAPAFDFAIEADSGLRGFVAHIPAESLARGKHVLALTQLPSEDVDADPPEAGAPRRERIAFWR